MKILHIFFYIQNCHGCIPQKLRCKNIIRSIKHRKPCKQLRFGLSCFCLPFVLELCEHISRRKQCSGICWKCNQKRHFPDFIWSILSSFKDKTTLIPNNRKCFRRLSAQQQTNIWRWDLLLCAIENPKEQGTYLTEMLWNDHDFESYTITENREIGPPKHQGSTKQ